MVLSPKEGEGGRLGEEWNRDRAKLRWKVDVGSFEENCDALFRPTFCSWITVCTRGLSVFLRVSCALLGLFWQAARWPPFAGLLVFSVTGNIITLSVLMIGR